jgi:hypothetical protein
MTKAGLVPVAAVDVLFGSIAKHWLSKAAIDISRLLHDAEQRTGLFDKARHQAAGKHPISGSSKARPAFFFGPNSLFPEFLSFFPFWHPCVSA